MSILQTELKWRHATEDSDAGSNGGRMTGVEIPSAVKNNLWPDVGADELLNGSTKYRKAFIHIANDDDLDLVQARVFIETVTGGDDMITLFQGTQTDTESDLTGAEQQYGGGQLNADVIATATTCDVMIEDAALDVFKSGFLVRISDKSAVDQAGNEEYVTLTADATYVGDVATLTFAGDPLVNGYTAASTRVSSVIEAGTITGSYTALSVTTAGTGDYDDTAYPVLLDHIASVEQTWTLLFTSATEFTITGDTLAGPWAGNTSSTTQPSNPDYGKPYFILNEAGFSGIWASGDTLIFTTHPASIPLWYKRIIPAASNSLSGNTGIVGITGESS